MQLPKIKYVFIHPVKPRSNIKGTYAINGEPSDHYTRDFIKELNESKPVKLLLDDGWVLYWMDVEI